MSDLTPLVCETIEGFLGLGCERFQACGATFIRNRATPTRYDANTICLIREGAKVPDLLAQADLEYEHLDFRNFHIDPLTPSDVEAGLAAAGYTRWSQHLVMVLEHELHAAPRDCDIRKVKTEKDWQAYHALSVLNVQEDSERVGRPVQSEPVLLDLLTYIRGKSPEASTWMAYDSDVPCAYLTSWPGENGVGQLEDLFTHTDYRHRGFATALIAHCVTDTRNHGAGPVVIIADPTDTPLSMYATMGFRPLFIARSQYK